MAEFETPTEEPKSKKAKKSTKKEKVFEKRKVAIKFSYEGTNYNGYQRSPLANGLATVEDHLFNAMLKEGGYVLFTIQKSDRSYLFLFSRNIHFHIPTSAK